MYFEPSRTRWVRGVDFRRTEWLDGIFIQTALLKDTIDATYAASTRRRQVRKARKVQWTSVNPCWLLAFGFKVALVVALAFTSLSLKRAGFRPVAHDERRLAELLGTELQRQWCEHEGAGIFLNAAEGKDGLLVYADSQPTRPPTWAMAQHNKQGRRRNVDLHRAEEAYL